MYEFETFAKVADIQAQFIPKHDMDYREIDPMTFVLEFDNVKQLTEQKAYLRDNLDKLPAVMTWFYAPNYRFVEEIETYEQHELLSRLANKIFTVLHVEKDNINSRRIVVNGNCLSMLQIRLSQDGTLYGFYNFRSTNAIDVLPIDVIYGMVFMSFAIDLLNKYYHTDSFTGLKDNKIKLIYHFNCLHAFKKQPSLFCPKVPSND